MQRVCITLHRVHGPMSQLQLNVKRQREVEQEEYRRELAIIQREHRRAQEPIYKPCLLILSNKRTTRTDSTNDHPVWTLTRPLRIKQFAFNQVILPLSPINLLDDVFLLMGVRLASFPTSITNMAPTLKLARGFYNAAALQQVMIQWMDSITWTAVLPSIEINFNGVADRFDWLTANNGDPAGDIAVEYDIALCDDVTLEAPASTRAQQALSTMLGVVLQTATFSFSGNLVDLPAIVIDNDGQTTTPGFLLLESPNVAIFPPIWLDLCSQRLTLTDGSVQTGTPRTILARVPFAALIAAQQFSGNQLIIQFTSSDMTFLEATQKDVYGDIDFYFTNEDGEEVNWNGGEWSLTVVLQATTT